MTDDALIEGNPVKYVGFENIPISSKHPDTLSFIIADNGDLLVFIGEVVGTYTMLRE